MNVVSDKVAALVQLEYEADCKDHGPLASLHEGYAVLKEETEELEESCNESKDCLTSMWQYLRMNDENAAKNMALRSVVHAAHAACEAIQVAAVCKRILDLEVGREN